MPNSFSAWLGNMSRRGLLGLGAVPALAAVTSAAPLQAAGNVRMRIDRDMTISDDLILAAGEGVVIAPGATLRLLGDFQAPLQRVFTGGGSVDFNQSRVRQVAPEWWGAHADDPQCDCAPGIEAALAAHPWVQLGPGDYHLARTLVMDRSGARLWGVSRWSVPGGRGTRLVLDSARGSVLRAGPASSPGVINNFRQGLDLRWLELARNGAPGGADAIGLDARFVLHSNFEGLDAPEHAIGFRFQGAVRVLVRDCRAFRSFASTGSRTWIGFHLDGRREIGLAGGNASLFLQDCNATIGGNPALTDGVGLWLQGAFADSFITDFETSSVPVGIRGGGAVTPAQLQNGQLNLHLTRPIIDQCSDTGIDLSELGAWAAVDITDPYVAVAPHALAAIRLSQSQGQVTISGGQLIGRIDGASGGNALGLHAVGCVGLDVSGLKIIEHRRPFGLDGCAHVSARLQINNPSVSASQAALWMRNCRGVNLDGQVRGKAGAFPQAVLVLGAGSEGITVSAAGLSSDAVAGGKANLSLLVDAAPAGALSVR